ncbi:alpha/beta fold hydrolase [Clostridium estertheticum]|uniref:Alpha/beta hydrolase n=1 Tax=Clostridium estertheticum TaxID=238834 RepID=A0AA47EM35_9CLOT|nr:alpha/beta hydrolase [Clostridium estertheticum]MBU3156704.1 alpha/beta hydrolase [Clostridium estertheticum]WAG62717.1 alpha/beta hydrolase [Clostridium estertheticum]
MKKALKITRKVLLWIIGIIVGLVIISAVTHNVLKSIEKNKYKSGQTINVDGKNMQAYVTGSGKKTIVLLSGLGTASPITDFMPLAERLSSDYKVVILECFGYGFSDTTKEERSNANIVKEIRTVLKELKINGPYILMPHSISGIYSMYYAVNYPKEVEAIIGIDESKPNQTKSNKDANMSPYLTLLNTFGIVRDITYLLPSVDDGMNKNNYYSTKQIKMKKMATTWNSGNVSVINEFNMVNTNTKELYDVKYPNKLPVLSFLSKESVDSNKEWLPLHEDVISNSDIQKIQVLSGKHYLYWTNADKIAKMSKEFISTYVK